MQCVCGLGLILPTKVKVHSIPKPWWSWHSQVLPAHRCKLQGLVLGQAISSWQPQLFEEKMPFCNDCSENTMAGATVFHLFMWESPVRLEAMLESSGYLDRLQQPAVKHSFSRLTCLQAQLCVKPEFLSPHFFRSWPTVNFKVRFQVRADGGGCQVAGFFLFSAETFCCVLEWAQGCRQASFSDPIKTPFRHFWKGLGPLQFWESINWMDDLTDIKAPSLGQWVAQLPWLSLSQVQRWAHVQLERSTGAGGFLGFVNLAWCLVFLKRPFGNLFREFVRKSYQLSMSWDFNTNRVSLLLLRENDRNKCASFLHWSLVFASRAGSYPMGGSSRVSSPVQRAAKPLRDGKASFVGCCGESKVSASFAIQRQGT